ncbi:PXL1 Paxillin-like protein 1 [Candida maltosa Xu316]
MPPQMMSFPTFIRKKEQSPKALDGAFPPFKIEHRYKSVYERAGFDVNKGTGQQQNNNSESRSLSSKKSDPKYQDTASVNSYPKRQQPARDSGSKSATSPTSATSSSNSSKSSKALTLKNGEYHNAYEPPLTNGSSTTSFFNENELKKQQSQPQTSPPPSVQQQEPIREEYRSPPRIPTATGSNDTLQNDHDGADQFDFSPSPSQNRNLKGLKLDLNEEQKDNISDTGSLPGLNKVGSHPDSVSGKSVHSNESKKQAPSPTKAASKSNDIYSQQGYQVSPQSPIGGFPPQQNGAPFDPRRQRHQQHQQNITLGNYPVENMTPAPFHQHQPQPQYPQQQQQRPPYPMTSPQNMAHPPPQPPQPPQQQHFQPQPTRNMSPPTNMYYSPPVQNPYPLARPRPASPKLPMMTLNSSQPSAYRPNSRSNSPGLPPARSQFRPQFGAGPPQQIPYNPQQHPVQLPYHPQRQPQVQSPSQSGFPQTPYQQQQPQQLPPPRSRQPTYSQIRDDKLTSALDEFKHDIESHKQNSPTNSSGDDTPSDPPSALGLSNVHDDIEVESNRFSYGHNNVSAKDPSSQFKNFANQQLAKDGDLNDEYQQFLTSQHHKEVEKDQGLSAQHDAVRQSRLSMVSSIISKDSAYNEEDDAIEKELQRQLESLKMSGSSLDINKVPTFTDVRSMPSANEPVALPEFKIQDVDEAPELEDDFETTKPLSVVSSNVSHEPVEVPEIVQPHQQQQTAPLPYPEKELETFDDTTTNEPQDYDESFAESQDTEETKPLSPKTHSIEQELQSMNFQIQPTTESPSVLIKEVFESFPSGTGPCRSCYQEIDPMAKGSKKAIFSKTGELSGQWHRSCFTCSYDSCSTAFNKHVQCYVFSDKPYCFEHYHILNNSCCKHCNIGIEGECIENELEEKWHLSCLSCGQCGQGIRDDYFVINSQVTCHGCKNNMAGGLSVNDRIEKRRTRIYNV